MNTDTLIQVAREPMTRLRDAVGETVGLGILDKEQSECIVIAWVPGTSGLSFSFKAPYHIPLHCNAPGKAFLASLPEPELKALLKTMKLKRFTRTTLTTRAALLAEVKRIRKTGYVIDRAEQVEGCHCLGAPILNAEHYPIAALWTTGTIDRIPEEKFATIATQVVTAANEVARLMASPAQCRRSLYSGIVEQAQDYMSSHIGEQLDMEKVAKNLNVGYSWFRRIFRRETGASPNSYHMNLRLTQAQHLLKTTDMPIKAIAEQLGYENQYYFSNVFRKKTGMNPSKYRREGTK